MPPSLLEPLPEVFLSNAALASAVSRAVRAGRLRKLGPRLYTKNTTEPPEALVRRHKWIIAGLYFPGAVIVDRTAFDNDVATDGSLFLASDRESAVALPGLILRTRPGAGPLPGDLTFIGGLHLSSPARAYLENLRPARARGGVARRVGRAAIERRLDRDLRTRGESYLNELREDLRRLAPALGLAAEAKALDALIGALLGTREAALVTRVARARHAGRPYDPKRLDLLGALRDDLARMAPSSRPDPARPGESTNLSFFEAYFSNFIEGTRFELGEARAIVFDGTIPTQRPADAHDVLGTFRIVADPTEMRRIPETPEQLTELLCRRHAVVMQARPEQAPGRFKTAANQAGSTVFVAPDLVHGTLAEGFALCRTLTDPLQRATFMMCLISEVHPFSDGNGRIARIMMNAELAHAGERRILIPTVYRANYVAALKGLSHNGLTQPIARVLDFAQRYTRAIDFTSYDSALAELRATHAFEEPTEAEERGVRLMLPSP